MYGDSLVKGMTERNIWQEEWQEISKILERKIENWKSKGEKYKILASKTKIMARGETKI